MGMNRAHRNGNCFPGRFVLLLFLLATISFAQDGKPPEVLRFDESEGRPLKIEPSLWRTIQGIRTGTFKAPHRASLSPDPTRDYCDCIIELGKGRPTPRIPGVITRVRVKEFVTATVDVSMFEFLAADPSVRAIWMPRDMHPKNDTATRSSIAVHGTISTAGEVDTYSFQALVGESVTILLHDSPYEDALLLDPALTLSGPAFTSSNTANTDDGPTIDNYAGSSNSDGDDRIDAVLTAGGTYTIQVSADSSVGPNNSNFGTYILIIQSDHLNTLGALTGGDVSTSNPTYWVGSSARPLNLAGVTGTGVIVGVIDGGIDWDHPDFIDDTTGQSRILYIWDQGGDTGNPPDVGGDGNAANDYGTEYLQSQISAGLVGDKVDDADHGTMVTGCAAGDGSGTNGQEPAGRYQGVAPGADIIFVKPGSSDCDLDANYIDALDYIVRKAISLGKPVVINLSSGSDLGPHDGTGAFATGVAALTGPGRIMTVSAGNEGDVKIHARNSTPLSIGVDWAIPFEINNPAPPPATIDLDADIEIWTKGGNEFTVTVTFDGVTVGPVASGSSETASNQSFTVENRVLPLPSNGATRIFIDMGPPGMFCPFQSIPSWTVIGTGYTVTLTPTVLASVAEYADAWISDSGSGGYFTGADANTDQTLINEATSDAVITVGSYNTKFRWDNTSTKTETDWSFEGTSSLDFFGNYTDFSSRGPTRTGALKPDILAPGHRVCTTRSLVEQADEYLGIDEFHTHTQGTSFSAPHVAGIIALMFQKNAYLDPATVKTILSSSASTDVWTAGVPNNTWGAGKANAWGAFDATSLPAANSTPSDPSALEQGFPFGGTLAVGGTSTTGSLEFRATVSDADGHYVRLEVEIRPVGTAFSGTATAVSDYVTTGGVASVAVSGLANQGYHWQARSGDTGGGGLVNAALSSSWVVYGGNSESDSDFVLAVPPPASGGGGGGGGGGCGSVGLDVMLPLLGIALFRRIRRRRFQGSSTT